MRRSLLPVLLAALVLTAGCSFLGGGGTTPTSGSTPTASPTATDPATASPTPTATPTPTPAPSQSFPAGYSESGVTDAETALSSHVGSLADRRSFIVDIDGSVVTSNGTQALRQLQSVDIADDRALVAVNGTSGVERTSYFGDGKRYLRVDPPGENNTRYNVTNATLDPRGFTGSGFLAPVLTNASYGEATVNETANGTFYSYSATSVDRSAFRTLLGPSVDPENVTRFDAGIVVDEEGVVRRMGYRAVVDRGDDELVVSVALQTYAIDEVDISPPPWLDEARQADSS
jgi:hypothetical protein